MAGTQLTLLFSMEPCHPPWGGAIHIHGPVHFQLNLSGSPSPEQTHPEVLFHGNPKHCQVAPEDQPSQELNSKAANAIANRTQSGSDEPAALGEGHSLGR